MDGPNKVILPRIYDKPYKIILELGTIFIVYAIYPLTRNEELSNQNIFFLKFGFCIFLVSIVWWYLQRLSPLQKDLKKIDKAQDKIFKKLKKSK